MRIALIGAGQRGSIYAAYLREKGIEISAVVEPIASRRNRAVEDYDIPQAFSCLEDFLAQGRIADAAVVATMDRDHFRCAMPLLKAGYHLLLEKPISPDSEECLRIQEAADARGLLVMVCHVLRYTEFFTRIKDIIDSGELGRIQTIEYAEYMGNFHMAHSFVRGKWNRTDTSSPIILQKSCHDMDILTWLVGKPCKSVSSIGSNTLFRPERAPEGASLRCLDGCKAKETCPFDAEKIYVTSPKTGCLQGTSWLAGVLSLEATQESTYQALREGPYGRCVYHCDNDVVDHQQTNLLMEDGSTISFTMCAFTEDCYRTFKAMGTKGEIEADMKSNLIRVREFGKGEETIDVGKLSSDLKGHGGGDSGIVKDFLEMLLTGAQPNDRTTTLEHSMESHFIALAAEESRLHGGQVVDLEEFRART